ncbi:MAG: hypothetical protein K2L61_01285, partial [Clostridia bacterium]|nr:hypothetical protein [Clostridia bacterium]
MEDKTLNQDLENTKVETGNTPDETPKKKKGIKGFLQLVLFIVLSMAGFVVQMIIEQVCQQVKAISEPINNITINGSTSFDLFGISTVWGPFFVTLVAVFLCKIINFILHRKVLFKPRHNLAFGIVMYILFSVVLWFGSALVKAPVRDALMNWTWWTDHITKDPEGWAVTAAVMVYSTADLIIMFFAEKFLIMNDKLFKKKGQEQVAVAEGVANVDEKAVAADSAVQEDAQAVAEEVKPVEETFAQDAFVAQESVEEIAEEKVEEQVIEETIQEEPAPVVEEIVEEIVEEVQETPAVEEPAQEEVIEQEVVEVVEEQEVAQEVEAEAVAEVVEEVEEVEEVQPETVE